MSAAAAGPAPASARADSGSSGASAGAGAGASAGADADGEDLSLEAFVQLRAKLASVLEEKEQLAADVAALCEAGLKKGRGGMLGAAAAAAGYLISDQSAALRNDNALLRQQLRSLAAERDSLGEDISQLRASKVQSDRGWRDALARAAELEGELGYYRASNARAITDRDTALFEAGQLRDRAAAAEQRASILEASLDSERLTALTAEREARAGREAAEAEAEAPREGPSAGGAAAAQGERAKLREAQAALRELEEARDKIKVELLTAGVAQKQAYAAQQQAEARAAAAEARAAAAEEALAKAEARVAAAEGRAKELESSSTELLQSSAQAKEQASRARAQAAALQKQLNQRSARESDLETTLEQLTAALVAAQAGLKELQQQQSVAWRAQEQPPPGAPAPASPRPDAAGGPPAGRASSCGSDAGAESLVRREHQVMSLQMQLEESRSVNDALNEHCNHLKERLADAVKEKVEALLLAADAASAAASERMAGGGGGSGGGAAGAGGSGGGVAAAAPKRAPPAASASGPAAVVRATRDSTGGPAAAEQAPKAPGAPPRVWLTSR
ncbi:hypothetical protein Rsub_01003 [Raphidocelis subcapitata]|uniref:Uncharacterized protein n=1 Tax=Raphidocelis subcapitata TaxID=307507 RepID=A0A2V0NLJ9_9CHLO|nr:hypothetical protein Rsub_01003 [Raphidocelis subcapitata]|eukprot:GBF88291.1 hypothetical protein Rsub_01003 [Raphidocelis subcapitata]